MRTLVTLNRRITKNVGDLASGPLQYFPDYKDSLQVEITNWSHENLNEQKKWYDKISPAQLIVIGGGGLLEWEKYRPSLEKILSLDKKAVIWGAGQNHSSLGSWAALRRPYVDDYSKFKLVGVRDYGTQYEWVPDASCLSTLFDKKREIKQEFAFQVNRGTPNFERFMPIGIPENQIISNVHTTFEQVLDYFGSAETVVTTSFHGTYWAILLGRKVVSIPMSSKIYTIKHPVPLAQANDWRRFVQLARTYPEALEECRSVNLSFAERVFNL